MSNVTDHMLYEYVETFHETLRQTASEFLAENDQKRLLHAALLPAKITGYVSTQFGVALEYEPAASLQSTLSEEALVSKISLFVHHAPFRILGRY